MPASFKFLISLLFTFLVVSNAIGQDTSEAITMDTISKKEERLKKKDDRRLALKNSHARYAIKAGFVFASLETKASFMIPNTILSANISLEENFGLADYQTFFTGSFIYRATPRSGIYADYYAINRGETKITDQDYIFLGDTIPAGLETHGYFNTQVLSAGYLLSILQDPHSFLGAYFNLYFMNIETGVRSDIGNIDLKTGITAPLPNFGLVAMFRLTKWLALDGNIGFFSLNTDSFGGNIYSFKASVIFKPIRWIGISLSYQEFDVKVYFISNNIETKIEYNFRGPAVGLCFTF